MKKKVAYALIAFLACVGFYITKNVWYAHREFKKAKVEWAQAQHAGSLWLLQSAPFLGPTVGPAAEEIAGSLQKIHLAEALTHCRRALEWNIYHAPCEDLILGIAEAAKASGFNELSLKSYQDLRSVLYGARGLWQPKRARIRELDREILHLLSQKYSPSQVAVWASDFQKPSLGAPAWSLVMTLSFFAWIFSIVLVIARGFSKEGQCQRRCFLRYALLSLAFMGFWLFSLARIP